MIKIENKQTSIPLNRVSSKDGTKQGATYKDLIESSMDILPQGGFTPEDIRNRNRIQKALEDIKDNMIELEDADYKNLQAIVELSRWASRDVELSDFLNVFVEK